MPRTLTTNNKAGSTVGLTEPLWLLELAYTTPIYLSSREDLTVNSKDYIGTELDVRLQGPGGSVTFFNSMLANSGIMLTEGTGVGVTVYLVYGAGPFTAGDLDNYFSGIAAHIEISSNNVELQLKQSEPFISPIHRASHPVFKHLPPDGLRVQTRSGIYVLNRRN
jgi:hypothetical protein